MGDNPHVPERFIDVCEAEPLEAAIIFGVLTSSRLALTARGISGRLRGIEVNVPAEDVLLAIKQLCERGHLVREGWKSDWSIEVGWRNAEGKKKFQQQMYRVRYEGE